MTSLDKIALQRISIEFERLREETQNDSVAMHKLHAAKGKLGSGQTITEEIKNGKNAFCSLRDLCINQIGIVTNETLVLPETTIADMKSSISSIFVELYGVTFETMTKSCKLAGKPDLRDRYMPEIEKEMSTALSEVKLFIDERVIVKRNRGIKGVSNMLFGWFSKIFTSGAS
jgi:hypothetical protein